MKLTLDTNVLARVLVDDDAAMQQCAAARAALARAKVVFVPQVVQVELCWVLERAFALRHAEICTVLRALQATAKIELEQRAMFDATLDSFARDAAWGFADCLIATGAAHHQSTVLTFDKRLARLSGATLVH